MREAFVNQLIELAKTNKNIELLSGDLGFGVLKPYWTQLPEQFMNAGIAEQNMLSMASGMAMEGKIVVVYSIGNFPTVRALEQIRNDCAYHGANVKIVCVGSGFAYGSLGMSHHATEDIALLRALPDVMVICPGDRLEAQAAVKIMMTAPGTCYLRLGRGGEQQVHKRLDTFMLGKAVQIRTGTELCKIALFSTGDILAEAHAAVNLLAADGIHISQYSFPFVKPLDEQLIRECAQQYEYIFTLEEHNIVGGFGGAVAEVLAEVGTGCKLVRLGIKDTYCEDVGDQQYLRALNGINAQGIAERIKLEIGKT